MESVRKVVHYKRAVITGEGSLQEILLKVFADGSPGHKIGNRKEIINQDDQSFRVVNRVAEYSGMQFYQVIHFEPGRSQAYILLNEDADSYPLDALTNEALNKLEGKEEKERFKKEFVDSILYFGVFENHVVILQSHSLRSRELEAHLGWLIGKFGGVDPGTAIILQDQPTQETISKLDKDPVKTIHLGSPVASCTENVDESDVAVPGDVTVDQARKVRFFPRGLGADLIMAALGTDWFEKLSLDDDLDEANLKVSLEITYLRRTTKTGQRVLDNLATSLRHMDDADVRIELTGGGTISGNDLKLSGYISVKKLTNGLLDEGVLYHTMHGWLISKIRNGDADASLGNE